MYVLKASVCNNKSVFKHPKDKTPIPPSIQKFVFTNKTSEPLSSFFWRYVIIFFLCLFALEISAGWSNIDGMMI